MNYKNKTELLESVKNYLAGSCDLTWKEFVNYQEDGDCQWIVSDICRRFPQFEKCYGEFLVDDRDMLYDVENDEYLVYMHYWVTLNGKIYEFSKGTLRD